MNGIEIWVDVVDTDKNKTKRTMSEGRMNNVPREICMYVCAAAATIAM